MFMILTPFAHLGVDIPFILWTHVYCNLAMEARNFHRLSRPSPFISFLLVNDFPVDVSRNKSGYRLMFVFYLMLNRWRKSNRIFFITRSEMNLLTDPWWALTLLFNWTKMFRLSLQFPFFISFPKLLKHSCSTRLHFTNCRTLIKISRSSGASIMIIKEANKPRLCNERDFSRIIRKHRKRHSRKEKQI